MLKIKFSFRYLFRKCEIDLSPYWKYSFFVQLYFLFSLKFTQVLVSFSVEKVDPTGLFHTRENLNEV